MRLYTHTHTHTSVLTNSFFKGNPFHSGNGCNRGISLIALIITIIVIIILAAISIAGVSGIVERSRYAKFCGDLDAVQDAVSQAYGTKRIKEAQDPNGLKNSEEIYKWVATGGDDEKLKTAKGPNEQDLYKLADDSVLGLDLPKYGDNGWGVDPKTGEVFLVDGFEYDDHVYYGKADVQNGGKETEKNPGGGTGGEGTGEEEPEVSDTIYAKLYTDGTLILSSTDYTDENLGEVIGNYGTDIWHEIESGGDTYIMPQWIDDSWTNLAKKVIIHNTIQPTDTHYWFYKFEGTTLDLTNINTSNVTDMSRMFLYSSKLTALKGISDWDVGNVTNMGDMFSGCSNLATLDGISGWNVGKVTNMDSMFYDCSSLTTLDLSGWIVGNVTNMYSMFSFCSSLTTLKGISGWNVGKVTNMQAMFYRCSKLTTLDLSGWDIQLGTEVNNMFAGATPNLTTVYAKSNEIKELLKSSNQTEENYPEILLKDEEPGDDDDKT